MDIQLKKGILEACVLKVISIKPIPESEIIIEVSKYIEITEYTIIPILKRLQINRYIETVTEENEEGLLPKYFMITDLGIERLKIIEKEYKPLNQAMKFIVGGKK